MKSRRIRVEHLLGRIVYDIDNCKVGRIEEIEAEQTGNGCYVKTFVLGEKGLLERLSISEVGPLFSHSLAAKGEQSARGVPWDKIDISNPKRPRLRCRRDEL
ncbi:MAG: PRC-barrel domain containing protein [Chthoniobacterales bacterium]